MITEVCHFQEHITSFERLHDQSLRSSTKVEVVLELIKSAVITI